jgi:hypothetical protein
VAALFLFSTNPYGGNNPMSGSTIVALVLLALFILLLLSIFWPRKSPYVRRVTRSYNSRGFGRERDLY